MSLNSFRVKQLQMHLLIQIQKLGFYKRNKRNFGGSQLSCRILTWPTWAPKSEPDRSLKCKCWPVWGHVCTGQPSLKRHSLSFFRAHLAIQARSQQTFSLKAQIVNILALGAYVSIRRSQLCCWRVSATLDEMQANKQTSCAKQTAHLGTPCQPLLWNNRVSRAERTYTGLSLLLPVLQMNLVKIL